MLIVIPIAMLCLLSTSLALFSVFGKYLYSLTNNRRAWHSIRDKFVLITAATSEFGEALCMALARRGVKLVILGPFEDRLLELKSKLSTKADVLYHSVDIAHCTDFSFIEKYDIGLVINKIGDITQAPAHFIDQNIDVVLDFHLRAPLNFLKAVVTAMAEKHKGYIVNIAFGHSTRPCPYFSLSAALKCAFKSWSESMYYEMMPYNVNVEYLEIGAVHDSESKGSKPSVFRPTLETTAEWVVRTIGNSYFTVPYYVHFLQFILLKMTPKCIVGRIRCNINQEKMRPSVV